MNRDRLKAANEYELKAMAAFQAGEGPTIGDIQSGLCFSAARAYIEMAHLQLRLAEHATAAPESTILATGAEHEPG